MITSEMCSNEIFESYSQSSEYFLTTRFIPAQVRAKTDNHIAMNNLHQLPIWEKFHLDQLVH